MYKITEINELNEPNTYTEDVIFFIAVNYLLLLPRVPLKFNNQQNSTERILNATTFIDINCAKS